MKGRRIMGFWSTAGEIAGKVANSAAQSAIDMAEKCKKYEEEMQDYSKEELREVMLNDRQPSFKRAMAKKLYENY